MLGNCVEKILRTIKWKPRLTFVAEFYLKLFLNDVKQEITAAKERNLAKNVTERERVAYIKGLSFNYNIIKDFLSQLDEQEGE